VKARSALGDRQSSVPTLSGRTSKSPRTVKPRPTLGDRQSSVPILSGRTSRSPRTVKPRPSLGYRQQSVPTLSGRMSRSPRTVKARPTLGHRQQSVPNLSERTSRTVPIAASRPPLGHKQQSVPDLSERTSRTVPIAESRPPLDNKQQSVPNLSERTSRTTPSAERSFPRAQRRASAASSLQAAPPTRRVQPEDSSTSMVVALAGQPSRSRRKIVRKVRRVLREKTEPVEFDLRSPCKETREEDEAVFKVKCPEFVSPTSSRRGIPRELEIPFPAEELVAPVTIKSPSAQDSHIDPMTPVPSSARSSPAMNHSGKRVVMVVADYRKSKDLKKTRSLRSFVAPVTPVASSARRPPTMHQSANRVDAVGNDRDSKFLSKTSTLRSFLVKSKKVMSNRCMRSGADGGFLPVSEENNQEDMQAAFFGFDDFNDLVSRNSSRNEVKTGLIIPPPPVWTQSEFHQSNPEMKVSLFDVGDSETDDGNCIGRNYLPL
jgi:hypothetical protein